MGQIVNLAVRRATWSRRATPPADRQGAARGGARAPRPRCARSSATARPPGPPERGPGDFERAQQNFDAEILPQAELDRARSALDTARANVADREQRIEQARANLAGAATRCPRRPSRADRRHRDRPSGQGGRGHGHRHDEQPRHQPLTISDMCVVEAVMMVDETAVPESRSARRRTSRSTPIRTRRSRESTEVGSSPMNAGLAATSEAVNFKVKIRSRIRPGRSARASRSPPTS